MSKALARRTRISVEQLDIVDLMGVDPTGHVILTISDHLDWSNTVRHQQILQRKFNAYLAFIESGEIFQQYPEAKGRQVIFNVVFKHKPDREGCSFLVRARTVIELAGFTLRGKLFADQE